MALGRIVLTKPDAPQKLCDRSIRCSSLTVSTYFRPAAGQRDMLNEFEFVSFTTSEYAAFTRQPDKRCSVNGGGWLFTDIDVSTIYAWTNAVPCAIEWYGPEVEGERERERPDALLGDQIVRQPEPDEPSSELTPPAPRRRMKV